MTTRAWLAAVVLLAACDGGGDDDVLGVYQTTLHTRNDTGCMPGAAVADPPYFSFDYFGELNGSHLYQVVGCTSADAATCADSIALVADAPVGVFAFHQAAMQTGSTCTLDFTTYSGDLDGDTFELHIASYEELQASPPSCTSDDAGARGDAMPCISSETIAGTHL